MQTVSNNKLFLAPKSLPLCDHYPPLTSSLRPLEVLPPSHLSLCRRRSKMRVWEFTLPWPRRPPHLHHNPFTPCEFFSPPLSRPPSLCNSTRFLAPIPIVRDQMLPPPPSQPPEPTRAQTCVGESLHRKVGLKFCACLSS